MRYLLFSLILVLALVSEGEAQWKKVTDFRGFGGTDTVSEYITCVYFLDLPGPPRIGFVGTASELYRTSDGGGSWSRVWGDGSYWTEYIQCVFFADSLNGWFCLSSGEYDLYKTTNGGRTWIPMVLPMNTELAYGPNAVYYSNLTKRLFVSVADSARLMVSTDLGESWKVAFPTYTGWFSFSSPSDGIVSAAFAEDNSNGFLVTRDGGLTWDKSVVASVRFLQPLAIAGTPICFASGMDSQTVVYRSDDYGAHWREIYDFGPHQDSSFNVINPAGTGVIAGTLDRLYIQTDMGMYLSTDQGVSWKNNGGPSYHTNFTQSIFYSAKGVTIAGKTIADGVLYGGGLWKEDINPSAVESGETMRSFSIDGPFPNPSNSHSEVSLIVHCPAFGVPIVTEIFDVIGNSVSKPVATISSAPSMDRIVISAPKESGTYFIHVSAGSDSRTLRYFVN